MTSSTTSPSLLCRVKNPLDRPAWNRFVEIYTPLLSHWARYAGVNPEDANDLVQDILVTLINRLQTFDYDKSKSFRSWLKRIAENRAKNFHRDQARQNHATLSLGATRPVAIESNVDLFSQVEYQSYVATRVLELIKSEFSDQDWKAFWMVMMKQLKPQEVANALNISVNSVYLAKSKILSRLRLEARELLDGEGN